MWEDIRWKEGKSRNRSCPIFTCSNWACWVRERSVSAPWALSWKCREREGLESGLGVGERNGSRFGNRNRRRSAILTSGKGLFEACYDLGYVMAIELLSCGIEL
jgi:hypothetical protein